MQVVLTDENEYTPSTAGVLTLVKGKKYIFSCWVKRVNEDFSDNLGNFYYFLVGTYARSIEKTPLVEGWQRLEFSFTAPEQGTTTNIGIQALPPQATYFDDIRIIPFNASMKSYVYNPINYRLVAELDDNNYATFYNYDEEGILVQVKKETERGIMTLKTTRQNMKGRN